ncbi:CemA family protein [Halothece sp. PCC 7418]|uniref:proton extrusion protein PcxA n=1 Tax=Halothece sp. (strain PCC 7418) TaxID=65093 RepID=UPI0002A0748C|nr:proton extrusion protein PcxA [Halothece sp. PCC 7418]AFZ44826.1 CemA family protein [Halothece sp. PCC 7418]
MFRTVKQWFSDPPEKILEQAYRAALMIKVIEDEYFNQQPVKGENASYSEQVVAYFQNEVNQNLEIAKAKLKQFKNTRSFIQWSSQNFPRNKCFKNTSVILEKLNFIESVIFHYEEQRQPKQKTKEKPPLTVDAQETPRRSVKFSYEEKLEKKAVGEKDSERLDENGNISDQTSVLPRSLLRTLNRIKREIDPKSSEAEEEVVKTFRTSRDKTAISIRFLLILIIVPLLTHQITKTFVISPVIEKYFIHEEEQVLFINRDFEEEALMELQHFEETLRFKEILGMKPAMSDEEMEKKVKEKAVEIAHEYRHRSTNAIENIIADFLSVIAFGAVIYFSKEQIAVLKSFIDEFIYGLSDSAKAFIIILSTDMFVGYHSPHGWEVILEEIGRHFGLPESREFNFLFIATFPVILDTIFKYWIFRYLNRISPSAVATYRNMNE